ncbi:MAG: hypothetical protein PQJ61_13390 [Spirochaetales bacterium]|uniref:Uncharacterized protein n=1 Tax=Candidatus Thalassospirochaeta sargassi TaxID=3119039 RepID=A0AAJ1IEC5_9SPIO|nr:hypothetical protein [Spirochaetales bacterium]
MITVKVYLMGISSYKQNLFLSFSKQPAYVSDIISSLCSIYPELEDYFITKDSTILFRMAENEYLSMDSRLADGADIYVHPAAENNTD